LHCHLQLTFYQPASSPKDNLPSHLYFGCSLWLELHTSIPASPAAFYQFVPLVNVAVPGVDAPLPSPSEVDLVSSSPRAGEDY